MRTRLVALLSATLALPTFAMQENADREIIPFQKHVLENGLQVVLHEDHSDPVVAVYVYYHVGSSREEPGRSGFAHLFEHMLFQGSQNVRDDQHFKLIQEAGGSLNGTTNQDRTNYFETLPSNQLELALWLESDRMGFLLPAMTQEKLDNQRDVVKNERRQSYENRPYGLVYETVLRNLFPAGHPYSWPTIGSMADLSEASLEDVANFFRRWYGPNNATLAIGGDIEPEAALELVRRYFGPIPRGPAVDPPEPQRAALDASRRLVLEDRVQMPQLTLVWPTVEAWHADEAALDLLADVLSANRSSVLDRVLMIEEELASYVTISHRASERSGMLTINVRPRPGVTLDALERRVDELIAGLVEDGVDTERLQRLQNRREGSVLRSLETVSGRTNRLPHDNCFHGAPGLVREDLERHRTVTAAQVVGVARRYLHDRPRVVLSVVPEGKGDLAASGRTPEQIAREEALDRTEQPAAAAARPFRSPEVGHGRLENGVEIVCTSYEKIPLTRLSLSVPAGRLRQEREQVGLAELTVRMLNEGTRRLSGNELVDVLDGLGAELETRADEDEIVIRVSVLNEHLAEAAALLTEIVLEPRFAAEDFARVQRQLLVEIDTRADQIRSVATDVWARLVHGEGVQGAPPLGTRDTVERLTVEDVRGYWAEHARPRGASGAASLCFVGEQGPGEVARLFADLARRWEPGGEAAAASAASGGQDAGALPERVTVYLVDKPGAQQSELRIGHRGVAQDDPDYFPLTALNYVFGGAFSSRINLNLREDKGYTYGARSSFRGGRTPGEFTVSTAVKTDVTAPAVAEALKELGGIVQGVRDEEVEFSRQALSQSLGRTFESARARLQLLERIAKYGWPDDYPARRLAWLETMTAADLDALAREHIHPGRLVVLVVGDRENVLPGLRELGLGDVHELALDGSEP